MSRADSGFVYLHLFLARQPAVTVVAIKFHTREVNRRLFKIPMRAYTRRSISAFSEITIWGYHAQITQIASRFAEASNIFYAFSGRVAAQLARNAKFGTKIRSFDPKQDQCNQDSVLTSRCEKSRNAKGRIGFPCGGGLHACILRESASFPCRCIRPA